MAAPFDRTQAGNDNHDDNRDDVHAPPSELNCLIGVLPPQLLRDAARHSRKLGVGADRVLIGWGVIDETDYLRRLSRQTGLATDDLAHVGRSDIALADDRLADAARYGLLPLHVGDDLIFVVAPRDLAARRLTDFADRYPALTPRLRLSAAQHIDDLLLHRCDGTIGRDAADGLPTRFPSLSAAPQSLRAPRGTRWALSALAAAFAGSLCIAPTVALGWCGEVLTSLFLTALGLRTLAAFLPARAAARLAPLADADLPIYTVIVALYREATSVDQLLQALNALDYPREKLDLILACETDDLETRAAIARFGALPHLRVVIAPNTGPRTKPKALNCALPFARGSIVAVYDAEDRPDPGQLRAALDAFRSESPDVACVQASLCIENARQSLFARMFAAEYAGQFDAVLPGFAAMKLPLPLGGSSNHFRADALRAVGGWDAYNVTEDADLGLRLARFGYRAVTFASTTQEEAPIRFRQWLGQRSRWMKGWMQTWRVHMRDPRRLCRDIGWRGLVAFNLMIAGHVLSALVYPVFLATLLLDVTFGEGLRDGAPTPMHLVAVTGGLAATVAVGLRGLAARGRLWDGWVLLLTPWYWGCLSIATWRALWQLIRDPYRWEKTEHGLAGTRATPLHRSRHPAGATGARFARQR